MKSVATLHRKNSLYANPDYQKELLENIVDGEDIIPFSDIIKEQGHSSLKPESLDVIQMNLGYMCNQTCNHCHVDAGPDRKEIMTRETMEKCLEAIALQDFSAIDLTGGAPEMNPHFRWFVEELSALEKSVIVRCNLTIIRSNKKYYNLPEFYKKHKVEVVSSLPFYNADRTDRQRGEGVFAESVEALKLLNKIGYGIDGSGLKLNLVYNPSGAFLPVDQDELQTQFKDVLLDEFGIQFNELYAITNIPISRFLESLVRNDNYEAYMLKLVDAYNPMAVSGVMCRSMISVDWQGFVYDCDFNQMLDMKIGGNKGTHVTSLDRDYLLNRDIQVSQHCYGCTAGSGSSCGGNTL